MSREISSIRLVRLNVLCNVLGSETLRGIATPFQNIVRKIGYDEGGKQQKSANRLLWRDIQFLRDRFAVNIEYDAKKKSLRLFPSDNGVICFPDRDAVASREQQIAS